jgi:hypothetical protein
MRGRKKVETTSTALISSSKYMNDYRIREWVVTQSLKRNGRDYPPTYGIPMLIDAVREVQDHERIEELFGLLRGFATSFEARRAAAARRAAGAADAAAATENGAGKPRG